MFGLVARISCRTLFPKRELIVCSSFLQQLNDKHFTSRWSSGSSESRPRQNFHKDSENKINKHINWELHASYVYQAMAYHFDRDDVALPGFTKYFKIASDEEKEHAETFMKYQNKRGGRIVLEAILKPERESWESGLDAMKTALELEKAVNQSLLDLHECAGSKGDAQLQDFIESEFLGEQVDAIKEISDYITNLSQVGPGHGEWHFDKLLCEKCGK